MNMKLQSKWLSAPLIIVAMLLTTVAVVKGQSTKVSPKLDFDEDDDNTNSNSTNVPIIPGTNYQRNNNNLSRNNSDAINNSNTDSKSRPKIHGVRVTVDTGDNQKTKESKESVEIANESKHTKRVGIHTDITFEITADGDEDNNATNTSAQKNNDDKEDASVPIFKGRGSTQKPRNSHDPKYNWSPNFSAERRSYDSIHHSRPNYYPQYPNNVPIYTAGRTDSRDYRRQESDGWMSYLPSQTYWTTERTYTYNEPYRPNTDPAWKPCYCVNRSRRRRENRQHMKVVDSKLESPFST